MASTVSSLGLAWSHTVGGVAHCCREAEVLVGGPAQGPSVLGGRASDRGFGQCDPAIGCRDHWEPRWPGMAPPGCRDRWEPYWPGPAPPASAASWSTPVGQLLGDEQVTQVVLSSALVVLEQRVRVAQAVAGLRLHRLVLELTGQLQRLPAKRGVSP